MAQMVISTMVASTSNYNEYSYNLITTKMIFYTAVICVLSFFNTKNTLKAYDFWENWAGNSQCLPKRIYTPNNKATVIQIIKKAIKRKVNVRVVGSGHAWSDLVCTDGYIINTQYMNKVLNIDYQNKIVHIESGVRICDLNKKLLSHGLVLSNQTYNQEQTIAGAISTASHGSGHTGTLSTFIEEIELIDGYGNIKIISNNSNSNLFSAVKASLGSLGFIYSIKMKVEPYFSVKQEEKILSWKNFIHKVQGLHQYSDYSLFLIDPLVFNVLGYLWRKTKTPDKNQSLGLLTEVALKSSLSQNFLYKSQNKFFIEDLKHLESEYAIPINQIPKALNNIKKMCDTFREKGFVPTTIICRFVEKDDNVLMSPTLTGRCLYIGAIVIPDRAGLYEDFFYEFDKTLLECDGKPHWGKVNHLTHNEVKCLYGESVPLFNKARAILDPHGIFSNAIINNLLGKIHSKS